ncbi:MAG: FecR domain-containing protein, partial [Candidatus Neomarinimicrobiota bacterium]|nr:FecR domain-containing protein [Candidatus Neomarinimicrobiota bacterium]
KISKKIDLSSGTIRAQVENNRDFIVQTSVSVASVKGTDFWVISDSKIGDSVIGLEGIVSLSNRKSGEKIDIKAGITGFSTEDGSLQSFKSDPKNTPIDLTQNDDKDKQLEIIFKDSSGKEKKLIIEYK